MKLYEDIERASKQISGCYHFDDEPYNNKFYKIYPFTTENIDGYFSKLNINNKNVLTVGSSSDQIINAIAMGSTSITCFDLNPYVQYYFELKKAAIEVLDYNDFLNYFCYKDYPKTFTENKSSFAIETYCKISPYLKKHSKLFWDSLYLKFEGIEIRKKLFSLDEAKIRVLKQINKYLNQTDYNLLKQKIITINPTFITCNITDILQKINSKYDLIFLSNIACYLESIFDRNYLSNFKELIVSLEKHITSDGKIVMAYLYDTIPTTEYKNEWPIIFNLDEVNNTFQNCDVEMINFVGTEGLLHETNINDAVLVYKRKM
jgi:hypothetical protein